MGANILKIFDSAKKNLIYYIESAVYCINMRFFVSADNSSTDNRKKGFFCTRFLDLRDILPDKGF